MTVNDVLTVMWKERKGLLRMPGRKSQAVMMLLTPVLLSIVFPVQMGVDWLGNAFPVLLAFIVSMLVVGTTVPASFAGERERHTLSTLLASRLSDRVILFAKMAVPILLGWGMTLFVLLLSLVVVNVVAWDGRVLFYEPAVFLGALGTSLLMALLTAAAGVLFSLRAETVQQAQQTLMSVLLVPPMLLQLALFLVLGSSTGKVRVEQVFETLDFGQILFVIAAVMFLLWLVLLVIAIRRFQRERLILTL